MTMTKGQRAHLQQQQEKAQNRQLARARRLDAEEARERFEKRVKYFEELYSEPEPQPKKPSRKKKEPSQA